MPRTGRPKVERVVVACAGCEPSTGWIAEHRLIMEDVIGRRLAKDETVHHRDGQRDNNDPANLELWLTPRQRPGQRVEDVVAWCEQMLRRYRPELLAS